VLRLYDTRTGQVEPLPAARRGQLRIGLHGPALVRSAHLGDLRPYLLADLIRRAAEQHRLVVTIWPDTGSLEPAAARDHEDVLRTAGAALNIRPTDVAPQPAPAIDVIIDLRTPGNGAGRAPRSRDERGQDSRDGPPASSGDEQAPASRDGRGPGSTAAAHDTAAHRVRAGELLFAGTAMAEPAGNVVRVSGLEERGLDPLAFRLTFLGHQYREPLDLNWPTLEAADAAVRRWRDRVAEWATSPSSPMCAPYLREVTAVVDDDLDTPAALGALGRLEKDGDVPPGSKFETFMYLDQLLGLDLARDIGR
jgi:cysteinyl-tRNA synthetase